MFHVRWRRGESRRGREFTQIDPAIRKMRCPECMRPLSSPYTIVAVGPVDADEIDRYEAGRWFNAGATLLHTSCLDPLDDLELDQLCREMRVVPDPEENT
jgi:hypothetical protein